MRTHPNHHLHYRLPLLIICSALFLRTTSALLPSPPVQCNQTGTCTLNNAYGTWGDRKPCHVTTVHYPSTEEELRLIVANAAKNNLKVKAVSKFSHTIPKLACPDQNDNHNNSVLISTEKLGSGIEIDVGKRVVTANAGAGLRELIDRVEEVGLSLVPAPYWEGVSIGGLISTGAHGSSWWGRGGSVHDHVVGLSIIVPATKVDGYAKVLRLEEKDPLLNAAKVSLGLLGVISKVKLFLEQGFKRSITYDFTNDSRIEDLFVEHAEKNEFGDITWFPSKHTAAYRYDNRVLLNVSGNGAFDFIGFQANAIPISQSARAIEKAAEKARSVAGKCTQAATVLAFKKLVGNGLKNNNLIFTGYPVIGRQGKMQTSGSCLYSTSIATSCAWDPRINGLSFYETTAIFPVSKFKPFILDVKRIRDTHPDNLCGADVYNGFLIRFVKSSSAYLGQSEDSVVVDFNYYRADESSTPRLNQDIWEEIEQIAFFKYEAKPHWGKNRKVAFLNVGKKYGDSFNKFVAAKKELDGGDMFSSQWSDEIVFGKGGGDQENRSGACALEGECICSEDRHCSPENGYLCKQGIVYPEARVCRYSPSARRRVSL